MVTLRVLHQFSTVRAALETVLVSSFFDVCSLDINDQYLACAAFVNQNPKAFENAFWDIAAVRVYT